VADVETPCREVVAAANETLKKAEVVVLSALVGDE
jgi:hypothetical protein